MTRMDPANDDGNCLSSHHVDSRGGGGERNAVNNSDNEDGAATRPPPTVVDEVALSLNELMYSAHSFHVISLPVSITMCLAALAVTFVNTPETIQQGAALMSQAYHVWSVDAETDSTGKQLLLDFANGLVIVCVIGTMTFGIVLLYKYRCMKVLIGYMMFSSMTLLGVLGAELFNVAIEKYRIPIDKFTFVFTLYNFAVVGVTAIFYGFGVPPYVTQGYLICSSVIISWQLSHFDTISTWTLLIMLGLYDLCAVLTPCGPLRALVNLMSDEDSPEMPGLLYEAQIPEGLKRPVMGGRGTANGGDNREDGDTNNNHDDSGSEGSISPPSSMIAESYQRPTVDSEVKTGNVAVNGETRSSSGDVELLPLGASEEHQDDVLSTSGGMTTATTDRQRSDTSSRSSAASAVTSRATVMIPFAIAKLYRLKLTSTPSFGTAVGGRKSKRRKLPMPPDHISTSPLLKMDKDDDSSSTPSEDGNGDDDTNTAESYVIPENVEFTPSQMQTIVQAVLPSNGATVVKQPRRSLQSDNDERYGIIGSDGTLKRVLFVDRKNGKVYEEMSDDDDDSAYEGRFSNTIKLGLGDFIFYSVLVAKSAQYSFPCFISSFLVILAGLGGTLVLLAVYKHALPALPISIFLAVGFYVLVRFMAEPWIHAVLNTPFYV